MSTTVIILWIHFRDTANWILNWMDRNAKKRMAETEVQRCLDWLTDQKSSFERSSFGSSRATVHTASQMHSQNKYKLNEYKKNMEKVTKNNILTEEEVHALYDTYSDVQTLADRRSECFEVISAIANLEDHIQGLSSEFDSRAVHLVNMSENNKHIPGRKMANESLARSTQNCITGVRENWRWLDEVMHCAHVHMGNAANYHEFFHDVEEVEYWMKMTMSNMHLSFNRARIGGNRSDLTDIISETKDTMLAYLRWQSKVEALYTKAREVVPVNKRTSAVKSQCPVMALASYKTDEIEVTEGETLTLLSNENKTKWQVKNNKDQVGMVPSVILLMNGPSGEAIDAALRLKVQLLGLWTISIKRLGFQMIAFMQLVFKDWSDDEIRAIQAMPMESRADLKRIMEKVETTLKTHWAGYEGFEELQEKISRMKTILEEAENGGKPGEGSAGVVVQFKMLEDLFNTYQEFWTYWETYKVVVELVKQPKYLLVCDKWDQLRYVTTAHFVRFWDTKLELPTSGGKTYRAETALTIHETPKSKMGGDNTDGEIKEEIVQQTHTQKISAAMPNGSEDQYNMQAEEYSSSSTDVTEVRRRQETTTNEVVSTTEEMATSFIIKGVYDPRIEDEITLKEAIVAGILDNATGRYTNPITGKSFTLNEAMANGDLTVEFKSQRKIREEKSSYGIITVKTSQDTRPYSIQGVVDPKTGDVIPVVKARERGILSKDDDSYTTSKGDILSTIDAIEQGHVIAEFHGSDSGNHAEETKTYAVHSVVDQKLKNTVSFSEAINLGILDGEHGEYVNNVTGERLSITDAIMKGLIKARVITEDESSTLQIDPTNKIVVQRLAKTKQKILRAVKVAKAFQTNVPGGGKK